MMKWRSVKYEEDGHYLYQCLSCKKTWTSGAYLDFVFCPYCGGKFEGKHKCRSNDTPKWEYGRDDNDPAIRKRYENKSKPKRVFQIEGCMFHEDGTSAPEGWEYESKDRKATLDEYKRLIAEEADNRQEMPWLGITTEYRIIRVDSKW